MQRTERQARGQIRRAAMIDRLVLHSVVALAWVVWVVPWPVWHLATSGAGLVGMGFPWRRTVLANVRHVRAASPPPLLIAWYLGMQQIATHCKTVVSVLQASVRRSGPADDLVIEGLEHVSPYLGQRGLIIIAPHAGPYPTLGLLAKRWLGTRGFAGELVVVARLFRPFRSGALMDWFVACFARAGVTIIPADTPPGRLGIRLRSVLHANGIVVLLIDEPTRTPSLPVPFFDSTIQLPIGPVRLAAAMGSVIVPCIATYGRARRVTMTMAEPIEPMEPVATVLIQVARSLEALVARHLGQWSMLTPIWSEALPVLPPVGHSYADLHLHTVGSDGFCSVDEWVAAARATSVAVVAITDHDHVATVQTWKAGHGNGQATVLPGVELTARGRIVHLGVLFPDEAPTRLPTPGTPLAELVEWARSIRGSVVVLVHPRPLLWRWQLWQLARRETLPDAIETRFPLVGWRTRALERAAAAYNLAIVGGSDAHLAPGQVGRYVTLFPGATIDDLLVALHTRRTRSISRPCSHHPPLIMYGLQTIYSWLFPFRRHPIVARLRCRVLTLARARLDPDRSQDIKAEAVMLAVFPPGNDNEPAAFPVPE